MNDTQIADLIARAEAVVHPRDVGGRLFGDVGCALRSASSAIYLGVCIDTASGTGFCAEHSAIAAMVTGGEERIDGIVAVWKDEHGAAYVLPPCGRCREFICQVSEHNLDTDVILGPRNVVKLRELLPHHGWSPQPVEGNR